MEHVVFFPAPDGGTASRRVAALEEAVRLVEHLRNVEGVEDVSVHPLGAEVPLAFRTWYRVEVPAADEQPAAAEVAAVEPAAVVPAQAAPVAEPEAPSVEAPVPAVPQFVVPGFADEAPVAEVAEQPAAEPAEADREPAAAGSAGNGHRDVASLGFFAT